MKTLLFLPKVLTEVVIFQRFDNDPYVHKYVVLSLSAVVVTMLSGFTLQFTGIRGAKNLHSHMLKKILRVPMRFVCILTLVLRMEQIRWVFGDEG